MTSHTSHRPPGRTAYVQDKCRCAECRESCRVYEQQRRREALYGRWQPYVPADEARAHVRQLQAAGMGWKRVARAAGLSCSVMWKLLYGDPSRNMAPSKRIRPQTAAAILAVEPDLAPGALIDAGPTWRRIEGMVALGYPKLWITKQLGFQGSGLQFHEDRVQVRTAQAVAALADRVGDTPGYSTRARNYARARGWLTPMQQWAEGFGPAGDADLLDEIAIDLACRGDRVRLTIAERRVAVRRLHTMGMPDGAIAARLGVADRTVLRIRQELDLPAAVAA